MSNQTRFVVDPDNNPESLALPMKRATNVPCHAFSIRDHKYVRTEYHEGHTIFLRYQLFSEN